MSDQVETETLPGALLKEISRVREVIIPIYQTVGLPATFALMCMRNDLEAAEKAIAEGDVVEMIRCLEELRGYEA